MSIFSFKRKSSPAYSGVEFLRTVGESHNLVSITRGTGRGTIILSPMKSLSVEDFSYPFQNTAKIRDALKLQTMPYTAAGTLEIFPVNLSKSGRKSNGIVWYVSPSELNIPANPSAKIWPSPLPFVSKLSDFSGNGVTMCIDRDNVSSILWQSFRPIIYRWRKFSDTSQSHELSFFDGYCQSRNIPRGGNFIINFSQTDTFHDDFTDIISLSVQICPWISGVNLSRKVLEGARDLERTLRLLSHVASYFLIAGLVMLGAEAVRTSTLDGKISDTRKRSENYYRETFDPSRTGRISNPETIARDKISSISGKGEDERPLGEVLADMGEVFQTMENSKITMDIVRYNSEGIDCTGTAPDMTTVLKFPLIKTKT